MVLRGHRSKKFHPERTRYREGWHKEAWSARAWRRHGLTGGSDAFVIYLM
jgi:hypothetical protein